MDIKYCLVNHSGSVAKKSQNKREITVFIRLTALDGRALINFFGLSVFELIRGRRLFEGGR